MILMKNKYDYKDLEKLKKLFTNLAHNDAINKLELIENTLVILFGELYKNNKDLFKNKIFPEFISLKKMLDFNEDNKININDYKNFIKELNLYLLYHLFSSVNLVVMSIYDYLQQIQIKKKDITDIMFKFILYILLVPLLENIDDIKKFFSDIDNRLVIFNIIDLSYDTYTNYLLAENGYNEIKNKLSSFKWFSCCKNNIIKKII